MINCGRREGNNPGQHCNSKGICFTLGIELMLAADIVVAATDCRFAQIEVKRGLMPVGGATIRMVERAGWGNAQSYLLTADEFGAARLGLVSASDIFRGDASDQAQSVQIVFAILPHPPMFCTRNQIRRDRLEHLDNRLRISHPPQMRIAGWQARAPSGYRDEGDRGTGS